MIGVAARDIVTVGIVAPGTGTVGVMVAVGDSTSGTRGDAVGVALVGTVVNGGVVVVTAVVGERNTVGVAAEVGGDVIVAVSDIDTVPVTRDAGVSVGGAVMVPRVGCAAFGLRAPDALVRVGTTI